MIAKISLIQLALSYNEITKLYLMTRKTKIKYFLTTIKAV